ncbi:MAG: GNAT family N-acetyltransferase [Micromonosporaceae bacterium]
MTDNLPMRPINPDEWPGFWRTIVRTFHADVHDDESEIERKPFEPERSLAVFDGDAVVATTGIFTRDLSVPGAVLPAAHVTMVSVLATHRRRGLLNRMMRQQLADVRQDGREPVAVLWASEEAIYGRYGYGVASYQFRISADTREVRLPAGRAPGRLRLAEPTEVVEDLSRVYERVRPHRPGFPSRQQPWWEVRLADIERNRDGATERRCVLYENAGGVAGYALWRTKQQWDGTGPIGEVIVEELCCDDPEGRIELWRFLFDIDLTRRISAWNLPTDEPLVQNVDAPRRLSRSYGNALYARVVDVASALAGRRYPTPVDLVLEITDDLLPENSGRWRLTGDLEKASCERTSDRADLTLGIAELGAVYLGGTPLGALAAAGLVKGRPEAIAAGNAAFGWHVAPYAPEVF